MKRSLKLMTVCAAAALLTQVCFAHEDQSQQGGSTPSSGKSSATNQYSQGAFRVAKLIGTQTKDAQGQNLGTFKDFTLNPQTGEMFALIDIGNNRLATVPWQLLTITSDKKGNEQVTINTTKNTLQSAPSVTQDQWSSLNDPSFAQRVYSYFQVQPSAMGKPGAGPGGTLQGQGGQPQPSQPQPEGTTR